MSNSSLTKILIAASLLLLSFSGTSISYGQQETEKFIPIGYSPGISDKYSFIGSIVAVDEDMHTIVVESNRGTKTIKITQETRIWLDRSKRKRANTTGSYSDCEVGRKVEVMHVHDDETAADWIKVESS